MPGRQAHGRPVGGAQSASGKGKGKKRSKARSSKTALNAFAIASEEFADRPTRTPRNRELDAPLEGGSRGGKRSRNQDDEDEDEDDDDEDEDERPPRKMRRGADRDEDVEYGSDSSGNEWRIGVDEDDDSEIDSDDAFGESDEERFEDYAFRGSKGKQKKKQKRRNEDDDDEDEDDEDIDDADGASLGSDAIDLAQALDMSMSEDDEPGPDEEESSSDEGSDDEDEASSDDSPDTDGDEDDDVSESGINAWVSKFSGVKDADEQETAPTKKPKLGLKDLGLLGIKDPQIKKSLKLMTKEEKSSKPQKLDVPLARRQQAKLDRTVAYEKTNESLDRWTETVKHNRRAEHLVFPLPQNETGLSRHDNSEIQALNRKAPGTELEQAIFAIMEESGLGPSTKKETKLDDEGFVDADGVSRDNLKELWQQKRREREIKSREDARAKRIKKIKSKAYHRVHRKQREREEVKEHERMAANGEIDSEEEREAQDRQRAMERMGDRHRKSKWAKMSNKDGRAAWDDDVRVGIAEMARRDEELRRRIEGKPTKGNDDSDDDSDYSGGSDDVDERKRLLKQLDDVSDAEDGQTKSKLMNMQFMKKAEATKKKANDDLVAQIRRDLASDDENGEQSDDGPEDVGRRIFGQASEKKTVEKLVKASKKDKTDKAELQAARDEIAAASAGRPKGLSAPVSQDANATSTGSAWTQPSTTRRHRKQKGKTEPSADVLELGMDSVAVGVSRALAPAKKPKASNKQAITGLEDSSDDEESHLPIKFRDHELIAKAFGAADVVAEFEEEKQAAEEEDDDKVIDNTLPGWGSWVGDGVSKREKSRHQGRFLTKQEGIKKKDRKDAGLKSVIINEKRNKKNDKFTATQLPHPYESRLQYERALRLPVGPEWMTKETFQEATKPRVLMRQGIIAPISKPTH
ncbi:small-subunit processome [Annulohypoxylon maeteangense]|uniref:small-subunit processome n=1 Tax=Annulohypoxylon maeteangense TaxID=1927788 RepID=UPI00200815CE|nr:small-subunit processome [Annulohypoxylon maeteangense]KAI0887825.1 small-subunit processome [Annulohypoxylon maeteangense]